MSGTTSLSLCASLGTATCALRVDEAGGGGEIFGPSRADAGHTDLAAATASLFRQAGVEPRSLSTVLLDLGPGSYTGLRVAVTFSSFCRRYLGAEVRTVTSLELMVAAAWRAGIIDPELPTRAVLDARRKRFHHALVGGLLAAAPRAELLEPARATSLQELLASINPTEQLLCAPDLHPYLECANAVRLVEPAGHDATLLFDPLIAPRPAGAELEPLYLMGSYAEQPEVDPAKDSAAGGPATDSAESGA